MGTKSVPCPFRWAQLIIKYCDGITMTIRDVPEVTRGRRVPSPNTYRISVILAAQILGEIHIRETCLFLLEVSCFIMRVFKTRCNGYFHQ